MAAHYVAALSNCLVYRAAAGGILLHFLRGICQEFFLKDSFIVRPKLTLQM